MPAVSLILSDLLPVTCKQRRVVGALPCTCLHDVLTSFVSQGQVQKTSTFLSEMFHTACELPCMGAMLSLLAMAGWDFPPSSQLYFERST